MAPVNTAVFDSVFRAIVFGLTIVLFTLIAGGGIIYASVKSAMVAGLEQRLSEELVLFQKIYETGGDQALIQSIERLVTSATIPQQAIGFYDQSDHVLAGNVNLAPQAYGFFNAALKINYGEEENEHFFIVTQLDQSTLLIGRTAETIHSTLSTLLKVLILSGVFVTVATVLVGLVIRRNVKARMDKIVHTLEMVASGDSKIRLPTDMPLSEFNYLSLLINEQLERLSTLMTSIRNSISAIAHDLRSPLNRANLLLQEAEVISDQNSVALEFIKKAQDELSYVAGVFDTSLRIARIESSEDRRNFEALLIEPLLRDMAETYGPVIEDAHQTLQIDLDDAREAIVSCDRQMIRQLIANLLENASQHSPTGSKICLGAKSVQGQSVRIEVADNGPGIPPNDYEDVLKPFIRLEESRTHSGTGLGLAMVKAIADRHGADLTLSDNGPGLRVTVEFLTA